MPSNWQTLIGTLSNVMAWNRFNVVNGDTTVPDASGNGKAITLVNPAVATPGLLAADTDGALLLPSPPAQFGTWATSPPTPNYAWVMICLLRFPSLPVSEYILNGNGGNGFGIVVNDGSSTLANPGNKLGVDLVGVATQVVTPYTLQANTTYLVAIQFYNTPVDTIELWVNGVLISSATNPGRGVAASGGGLFKHAGTIDELIVSANDFAHGLSAGVMQSLWSTANPVPPATPSLALSTAGGLDTLTVGTSAAGTYPVAGYNLYSSATPGAEGTTPVATLAAPGSFTAQPTAAAGVRKYYNAKAFDNEPVKAVLSNASAEISSVTTAYVASGTTYTRIFTAPYGTSASGQSIGYTVYDEIGYPLIAHTFAGVTELPGTGIYSVKVTLDSAWHGNFVWDAPNGGSSFIEAFDPPASRVITVTESVGA